MALLSSWAWARDLSISVPTALLVLMVSPDLSVAASTLSSLARSLKSSDSPDLWHNLQLTARAIADALRIKDPVHDNHTLLGRSPLPTTLTNLLSLALHGAPVPDLTYTAPVNELLRVAANLSMDHSTLVVISSPPTHVYHTPQTKIGPIYWKLAFLKRLRLCSRVM